MEQNINKLGAFVATPKYANVGAAVIGVISGYYGGRTDDFIMRITDVFIAIPGLVLALALMAVTGNTSIESLKT